MAIQMTRAEYQAKYGVPPQTPATAQAAPIKMTRAEYNAKYGDPQASDGRTMLQKASDAVSSIFPGKKIGETIGTALGAGITGTKEAYGLVPKGTSEIYARNTADAPSVGQTIGDATKGAAMIAGAAAPSASSILGKAAQFGGLGAASGIGQALVDNKPASGIAEEALKQGATGAATGAAFGIAEKGIKSLGDLLGKTGDKIAVSVIKPSQADIKDGFSMDTVKKYNLGGSLKSSFSKTESTLNNLSSQLSSKLKQSNSSVDLNSVYENTAKRLLGNKLESFGSNAQMENSIEKLRNEIVAISGKNGLVSIPEAQTVKRASGHFGAWNFGVPTPEATASQKVYNTFYNELKNEIEKKSPPGVRGINQEISKIIPVMNALIRRIPVAERNSALSLGDIMSLSAAALDPRALSISLLNLASKSGTFGAALGKNAPKIGQAASNAIKSIEPAARSALGI